MAGRGSGPDFVEALARGLDVLACFDPHHRSMSLTEVAAAAGLARPTARRLLLTLEELGFVRSEAGGFQLTPKVLTLGMAYVGSLGLWEIARPHLEALVRRTGESSSMAQLDGSDIVYVARVSVPKIIALRVDIGTRFPAAQTSQGKVLLAALTPDELVATLARPSRSGLPDYIGRTEDQLRTELTKVRARGWALADEELAPGVRSIAVPVRDGAGVVRAAMNITVHAAETPDRAAAGGVPPAAAAGCGRRRRRVGPVAVPAARRARHSTRRPPAPPARRPDPSAVRDAVRSQQQVDLALQQERVGAFVAARPADLGGEVLDGVRRPPPGPTWSLGTEPAQLLLDPGRVRQRSVQGGLAEPARPHRGRCDRPTAARAVPVPVRCRPAPPPSRRR